MLAYMNILNDSRQREIYSEEHSGYGVIPELGIYGVYESCVREQAISQ